MNQFGPPKTYNEGNIIYVNNIPATQNAISTVYNYFKKYGKITSLWADGNEAIIVYKNFTSAKKAYEDPNSFLNNRFVSIRYHIMKKKNRSDLLQIASKSRVDQFAQSVEDSFQELVKKTADIKIQLSQKNLNERRRLAGSLELSEEAVSEIERLKARKKQLIIEATNIAASPEDGMLEILQSYRKQIDKIQNQIDGYLSPDNNNNSHTDQRLDENNNAVNEEYNEGNENNSNFENIDENNIIVISKDEGEEEEEEEEVDEEEEDEGEEKSDNK